MGNVAKPEKPMKSMAYRRSHVKQVNHLALDLVSPHSSPSTPAPLLSVDDKAWLGRICSAWCGGSRRRWTLLAAMPLRAREAVSTSPRLCRFHTSSQSVLLYLPRFLTTLLLLLITTLALEDCNLIGRLLNCSEITRRVPLRPVFLEVSRVSADVLHCIDINGAKEVFFLKKNGAKAVWNHDLSWTTKECVCTQKIRKVHLRNYFMPSFGSISTEKARLLACALCPIPRILQRRKITSVM